MSKKLLLADDSITIQKVIGITFANEDYFLSVVDNGDAALEKARAQRPDLILADVFMPGKNGYELCAAIKTDPTLQQIPVLLLAGTFEPFDEAKARKAGADGWIAKPFESQVLIDRVEELLARPRPAASAPASSLAVEAASVGPATSAVMEAQAVEEEDAEPDLWAELGPVEAPSLATPEAAAEPLLEPPAAESGALDAASGIDDLWGEVSLGEEDLVPVAPAAVGNDIWEELDVAAVAVVEAAEPAALAADDLWDDLAPPAAPATVAAAADQSALAATEEEEEVFLTLEDEEEIVDLIESSADDAEDDEAFVFVEDDELAQGLSEAAAQPVEDATTFVAAEPAEELLLELDDSDIMPLDDADILEEDLVLVDEPLELVVEESDGVRGGESTVSQEVVEDLELAELPLLAEDELEWVEEAKVAAEPDFGLTSEEPMAVDDAFDGLVLDELRPVFSAPEELTPDEPESLLVESQLEEEPLWDVVEPAMAQPSTAVIDERIELEPEVAVQPPVLPPITPVAPAQTAAAVEAQVQSLSEADLSRIVERVAGEVIERLAGTILERMAWEVVPDLAETLIREEIRKIRDNVA